MARAENYRREEREVNGVRVVITTYQIGDRFHCHIENKDPGATIARAEGSTREEACKSALDRATERLK
jgi:hypothetical protein